MKSNDRILFLTGRLSKLAIAAECAVHGGVNMLRMILASAAALMLSTTAVAATKPGAAKPAAAHQYADAGGLAVHADNTGGG